MQLPRDERALRIGEGNARLLDLDEGLIVRQQVMPEVRR
jgi:hypothetical protein